MSGGLVLGGATSGSIELKASAVAGANTLTLPAETGTVLTNNSVIARTQVDTDIMRIFAVTPNNTPAISTWTKIILDGLSFDTANARDGTNFRFNPKKPGYYSIHAAADITMTGTGAFTLSLGLFKNGIVYSYTYQLINYTSGFNQTLHCNDLVPMNGSSDYIELKYWTNSGTAAYVNANTLTFMTTQYVRKL